MTTLPDIETVSAKVHEAWMDSKFDQGVTSRKSENGEELMVPYSDLSEAAKDLDRGTVKAVYAAIAALSLQDHAKEVLCACANSCAKDTESTKLRAALQRMLAVCDIGAHDSYDIYRACEFARSSMVAEQQTSEAK